MIEKQALNTTSKQIDFDTRAPVSESTDHEALRKIVLNLWEIIDDIDTYSDMAKSDDVFYRSRVERKQAQRWETGVVSDGYDIYMP